MITKEEKAYWAKVDKTFICIDCDIHTGSSHSNEYYMVQNSLWEKATKPSEREGMLCIGCLEKRLGRKLNSADFTDCLVNREIFPRSERFVNRLNHIGETNDITQKA